MCLLNTRWLHYIKYIIYKLNSAASLPATENLEKLEINRNYRVTACQIMLLQLDASIWVLYQHASRTYQGLTGMIL